MSTRREGANLAGDSIAESLQFAANASTRAVACAMLSLLPMRPAQLRFSTLVRGLAVLALLLASRGARAQSVTGIVGPVLRVESDGTTSADDLDKHPHPGGVPVNAVNFSDCAADLDYKFVLGLDTNPNDQLVAYVGPGDCTPYAAREGLTPTCWPVTAGAIPQASKITVLVRMQDLAKYATSTSSPPTVYSAATNSACVAQTSSAGASLWLYFFFVDGFDNAIGLAQPYPVLVDTQAAASKAVAANSGDSSVSMSIPAVSDPDITGWNLYCDPPRGEETETNGVAYYPPTTTACVDASTNDASDASDGDAKESSDANDSIDATPSTDATQSIDASEPSDANASLDAEASTDAQSTAPSTDEAGGCSSGVNVNDAAIPFTGGGTCAASTVFAAAAKPLTLKDGSVAVGPGATQTVLPAAYLCGQANATDTSATITGLKDGYYYEIGVGATDAVGNVGTLATACGNPLEASDFYAWYWSKNGRAGGGFCSTDGVGTPAGTTTAFGALFAACCAAIVRRRRRR